jgi:hypothetical protein
MEAMDVIKQLSAATESTIDIAKLETVLLRRHE